MKLGEFQDFLKKNKIDVALFFNDDANLTYFSKVKAEVACLAIPSSGECLLFVPGFEADRLSKKSCFNVVKVESDFLKSVRKEFPAKKVGVIPSHISFSIGEKIKDIWKCELVSVEEKCRNLRLVKTFDESWYVVSACKITDDLFREVCDNMNSFKTELDVAAFLKSRMTLLDVEQSFAPIVASGANAAIPHHVPGDWPLKGFVVLDFGVVVENYCSDMTRTVFVGNPSSADKKVYNHVLKVQEECIKKVVVGNTLEKIDAFAHKNIGASMPHRVGHSLGLEVHDVQPRPWKFEECNIVTVEPGTYFKENFGIRIEDDIIVDKEGPIVINRSSKELITFR